MTKPITIRSDTFLGGAAYLNRTIIMNKTGASLTCTLPAATGSGKTYKLVTGRVNTSSYIINCASNDFFKGSILMHSADGHESPRLYSAADTSPCDQITLNGTTTGGQQIGDVIILTDIDTDNWMVQGWVTSSGNEATPFTHNPSSSISSSASSSVSSSPSSSASSSISSSPSSSVSSSPSSSASSSVSSSPSSSISGSPTTSPSASISSSPSTSVSSSPSSSASSSISSSPSSSVSSSISNSPTTSPSSSPS